MRKKGFTLIEVLVTLVILAVVAGLAVPVYSDSIERARQNEARLNLNAIFMGQKIYAVRNGGDFWDPGNTTANQINTNLNLDISANVYNTGWNVNADNAVNPKTWTAQVSRNGGGPTFTINQAGVITQS